MPNLSDFGGGAPGGGTGFAGFGGTGFTAAGAGNAASDFAGMVSSFMQIGTDQMEAAAYAQTVDTAGNNEQFSKDSTAIQQYQATRKIGEVLGSEQAATGAAGFEGQGSALDLLRESVTQGHLTHTMIGLQGEINANSYEQQRNAALMEERAANAAANTALIGGIMKGVAGGIAVAGMM